MVWPGRTPRARLTDPTVPAGESADRRDLEPTRTSSEETLSRINPPSARHLVPGLVALVAALGLAAPAVGAPPSGIRCGTVITQSVTLAADVGPCAKGGLVIGADNITVDLGGFRVFGKDNRDKDGIGILMSGRTGVTVRNGVVTFFDAGVAIVGGSANTVEDLLVNRNIGPSNGDFGDGIAVSSSSDNVIRDNNVTYNGPFDGIGLFGASTDNTIEGNFVGNNDVPFTGEDGIRIEGPGATGNAVRSNTVVGNTLDGIAVFGTGGNENNVITDNTVTGNGFGHLGARPGDGIRLFPRANQNTVSGNRVHDNAGNGIIVGRTATGSFAATLNVITGNTATGNARQPGTSPAFDLLDQNPGCDANTWAANVYGTAFPACAGA